MFSELEAFLRKNFHFLLVGALVLCLLHYRYGKSSFSAASGLLPIIPPGSTGVPNVCNTRPGKKSPVTSLTGPDSSAPQPADERGTCYDNNAPAGEVVGGADLRAYRPSSERFTGGNVRGVE